MATTYNDLYLDTRRRFKAAGVFDPTRAARELICAASGKTNAEFVRDSRLYVSSEVEREVNRLAERHLAGEPVAYLIGEWEFYGVPLDISRAVLIPRPDTEVLAERAIEAARACEEPRVLDLCAGSGCIGLAVAKHVPDARVILGELDEEAIKICRQNIRRNALGGRVSVVRADALEKPPRQLGEFDVIVSNPPYIPTADIETLDASVRDHEPRLALDGGADGLDFYRAICEKWRDALRPRGKLLFEVGIGEADTVLRLMRANGFGDGEIVKDLNDIPRVVCGTLWEQI
ncbi:MAG: peptide chain release factor N(5)-glutamine methyltransferase [Oscillospiraceae bacterium]|nr:peptide chain release factor N(5)-glutamine methyltransferase [Oscillospiraceae bacterium]